MASSIHADFRPNNNKPSSPKSSGQGLRQQIHACREGIVMLGQVPVRTLLALLLLSILFVLPTGLWLLNANIQAISHSPQYNPKITVYLRSSTTEQQALELRDQIQQRPDVQEAAYVSPFQGLKELVQQLGFSELFAKLPTNPLPAVITVLPSTTLISAAEVENLANILKALPQVASLQLNMDMVKQQYAYLTLWKKIFYLLESLLLIVVFLSFLNAMQIFFLAQPPIPRSEVSNFNRSFVYGGMFLSLLSAMIAAALILLSLSWVGELFQILFGQKISGFDGVMMFKLIVSALFLGVFCTWLVSKFCGKIA